MQCEKDPSKNLGFTRSKILIVYKKRRRYKECHNCPLDKQKSVCIRPLVYFFNNNPKKTMKILNFWKKSLKMFLRTRRFAFLKTLVKKFLVLPEYPTNLNNSKRIAKETVWKRKMQFTQNQLKHFYINTTNTEKFRNNSIKNWIKSFPRKVVRIAGTTIPKFQRLFSKKTENAQ